jgi:hypothetical protein
VCDFHIFTYHIGCRKLFGCKKKLRKSVMDLTDNKTECTLVFCIFNRGKGNVTLTTVTVPQLMVGGGGECMLQDTLD